MCIEYTYRMNGLYVQLAIVGLVTGLFIGLIGMGGGVLMIPMLLYLNIPLANAVAIGLAIQLIPQSIFGVLEYHRAGLLNIRNTVAVATGSALGIYVGSILITRKMVPEWLLYRILSLFMILMGSYLLIKYW